VRYRDDRLGCLCEVSEAVGTEGMYPFAMPSPGVGIVTPIMDPVRARLHGRSLVVVHLRPRPRSGISKSPSYFRNSKMNTNQRTADKRPLFNALGLGLGA